uniref:Conserved oligomeric Golgi complex subunit 8 n=1 Tax=Thelazia callipaeda TaxID=103827 RepID=A0A0N5CQ53_THECL
MEQFSSRSDDISYEFCCLKLTESKGSQLWDVISLPTRMDMCIRAGYYDMAYSLTNYGAQLQTHGLTGNPILKKVADKLIAARYQLLDELFNRFAGPIELAKSIQIVNNIRKIPYLSSTQLHLAILQYRDAYLEKQLIDVRSQSDFILKIVEIYRDYMYDTMVLYLAVFPENEITRRDSSTDPRWDIWQTAGPSAVLTEWVIHNLNTMFSYIKNMGHETHIDSGVLIRKLMSFALSFGRMGMDFRPLITSVLEEIIAEKFSLRVRTAAKELTQNKLIRINDKIPDPSFSFVNQSSAQPSAPSVLAYWDDLCVYGNSLIDALNDLRSGLSPVQINAVVNALENSLKMVVCWLCEMEKRVEKIFVERAVKLLAVYFIPHLNSCLLTLYPYEKCCRPFYQIIYSLEQYVN